MLTLWYSVGSELLALRQREDSARMTELHQRLYRTCKKFATVRGCVGG